MDSESSEKLAAILHNIAAREDQSEAIKTFVGTVSGAQACGDGLHAVTQSILTLTDSELRYRSIIDTAVDAIIVIDEHGIIQSCNEATKKLLGYSEAEIIGHNVNILMPTKIAEEHDQYLRDYLDTGIKKVIGVGREVQGQKKNGEKIDLFLSVSKMEIRHDIYFVGFLHDITQEKNSINALAISEAKHKAILDTAVDALIVIDSKGIIQTANQATEKLFGYKPEFLIGKNISLLTPEPIRSEHDRYLENYLQTGNKKVIGLGREVTALRQDGSEFYAHLSVSEINVAGEHLFSGIVRDISVEKAQAIELAETNENLLAQNAQKEAVNQFHECMRGEQSLQQIADSTLAFLAQYHSLLVGAAYFVKDMAIVLIGQYALGNEQVSPRQTFQLGEGLIGETIKQGKTFLADRRVEHELWAQSAFARLQPQQLMIVPLLHQEQVIGALELGFESTLDPQQQELLHDISSILAVNLATAYARDKMVDLLNRTQKQEEALRSANDKLNDQTQALQASEENLRVQSEELRVSNEELTTKMELVKNQQEEIQKQKNDIEEKARILSMASQYKSEFLSNMSHELRTPLNSLLLLSAGLAKNRQGNLLPEQLEDISVILKSGNTLLTLISDILDLSKVEAGKLDLSPEMIPFETLVNGLRDEFEALARDKGLDFVINNHIKNNTSFYSDFMRVEQILRNFLSNAFKFTEKGRISISLEEETTHFTIAVEDTGVGIPEAKQQDIFQAFQQGDGSTARYYGGTGLGLTISEKLAALLGGTVSLDFSSPDQGSRFSLCLPWKMTTESSAEFLSHTSSAMAPKPQRQVVAAVPEISDEDLSWIAASQVVPDDRTNIEPDSLSVLIIEDDEIFAKYLMRVAHKKHFNCIVALTGEAGFRLARHFQPKGIILDLGLPDIDGSEVLVRLKADLRTRHIPVHIISGREKTRQFEQYGVLEFLNKPISEDSLNKVFNHIEEVAKTRIKTILVIEDDEANQHAIKQLLKHPGLTIESALSMAEGISQLKNKHFDCIILDYKLPDGTALELLTSFESEPTRLPPVIMYTGQELTQEQYRELNYFTQNFVVKGAQSPERLLDEVTLFLHSVDADLQGEQQAILKKLHQRIDPLEGCKVLLVDDDLRNSFSLSKQLRYEGVDVIVADSGQLALEKLRQHKYVDLILMDIMMPEMDGYETMQHIRKETTWQKIPIIALTAKAMAGDKQKCLDAGANDYLSKPINLDKLLDVMRIWTEK